MQPHANPPPAPHFRFGPSQAEHRRGDDNCKGCRWDRPRPCECGDGLVHIEYHDSPDQPFVYYCDACSSDASSRKPRQIDYEI